MHKKCCASMKKKKKKKQNKAQIIKPFTSVIGKKKGGGEFTRRNLRKEAEKPHLFCLMPRVEGGRKGDPADEEMRKLPTSPPSPSSISGKKEKKKIKHRKKNPVLLEAEKGKEKFKPVMGVKRR